MSDNDLTAQQRVDRKNNLKRKGTPTFSAVRLSDSNQSAVNKKLWNGLKLKAFIQTIY